MESAELLDYLALKLSSLQVSDNMEVISPFASSNGNHTCLPAANDGCIGYGSFLLERLNECRQDDLLFDFSLKVEGRTFLAHRLVLASCSDYFRALFSHNMRDSNTDSLQLETITSAGMAILLDYAYTGHLPLNFTNLVDVLSTASFLQMTTALASCEDFMRRHMTFATMEIFGALSEIFGLMQVAAYKLTHILKNFTTYVETNVFLELDARILAAYLAADSLKVPSESWLLTTVLRWYEHAPAERLKHLADVIEKIRFSLDGRCALEAALAYDVLRSDAPVVAHLTRHADYLHLPSLQYLQCESEDFRVRSSSKTLVVFGNTNSDDGDHTARSPRVINYYFDNTTSRWTSLGVANTKFHTTVGAAVVEINNFAVVLGGRPAGGIGSEFSSWVRCMSGSGQALTGLPALRRRRAHHVAVHVPGYIFVIGGLNNDGPLSSVERLNIERGKWSSVRSMPCPLHHHAGASYHHKVYVSGGLSSELPTGDGLATSRTQLYNPMEDSWTNMTCMNSGRYAHSMCQVGGTLIVCGGRSSVEGRCLSSVEAYDIDGDYWTRLTSMRDAVADVTATALDDGLLMVVGGRSTSGDLLGRVQEYDIVRDAWQRSRFGQLPAHATDVLCCALVIKPEEPQDRPGAEETTV